VVADHAQVPLLLLVALIGIFRQKLSGIGLQRFENRHDHFLAFEFKMLYIRSENHPLNDQVLKYVKKALLLLRDPRAIPNERLSQFLDFQNHNIRDEIMNQAADGVLSLFAGPEELR